jgi:hypothetical protein
VEITNDPKPYPRFVPPRPLTSELAKALQARRPFVLVLNRDTYLEEQPTVARAVLSGPWSYAEEPLPFERTAVICTPVSAQ